jgi:hypothetical protein
MKSFMLKFALGTLLMGGLAAPALAAEETESKPLPTLLIKGEVVSVDANDPTAVLVKVKDRYGFETPIFVTPEANVTQGEATIDVASLITGAAVEVEYNFDVNTAKRHAVSVKVATPATSEVTSASAEVAAPATSMAPPAEPTPEPAAPVEPASEEPAPDQMAPATTP